MSFIGKEYKFVGHENFDAFLRFTGMPEDKVQAVLSSNPTRTLLQDGDTYTYVVVTPRGTIETKFQLGVEIDELLESSEAVKSTFTRDGNTITQLIKGKEGVATFKRDYNGDDLVVTLTAEKWDGVAKRFYKA